MRRKREDLRTFLRGGSATPLTAQAALLANVPVPMFPSNDNSNQVPVLPQNLQSASLQDQAGVLINSGQATGPIHFAGQQAPLPEEQQIANSFQRQFERNKVLRSRGQPQQPEPTRPRVCKCGHFRDFGHFKGLHVTQTGSKDGVCRVPPESKVTVTHSGHVTFEECPNCFKYSELIQQIFLKYTSTHPRKSSKRKITEQHTAEE
jgi:hypothetical protein